MVQTLKLSANKSLGNYEVRLTNFPTGTTYSKSGNTIKVIIPKSSITGDIKGTVSILNAEVKTCPAFYGQSYNDTWQDYVTAADPYEVTSTKITINLTTNNSKIKILKLDSETNKAIPNTTFKIEKDGQLISTITTKENGGAIIENLYPGTYKVIETKANENYVLPEEPTKEVTIKYGETATVEFDNTHKKGNIKVFKVDADNKIGIEGVEFELYSEEFKKIIGKYYTDSNGEITINNLRIGKYNLKETATNENYHLGGETNVVVEENKTKEVTIENEKKKGQIEVFKVDAENKEIKLEGVEFEVINSDNEVVEIIKTDKNGYAKTSRIPIGEYKLKEIKTDEMHILNNEIIKVDVTTDIVSRLDITNERIKGQIKIVKTSQDDSFISGAVEGTPIENVKFEVYDSNKNKVDEIVTNKDGIAITKKLDKGSYTIKEVEAGKWYLLNENEFITEIKTHGEIVQVDITNESEKPSVDIEKIGIIQTTANQEIRYNFKIKNTGNVVLDNFTWFDYLPIEYVRMSKLITGTYNQDLNYNIYYKTNLNDYKILAENLNTQVNNYIDFSSIELEEREEITEFKVDFGTVDVGFESVVNPYIFVKVNSNVENEDIFTNKTRIEGYNDEYMVWDEDDHITKVYEKEVIVKKLPRTGY